MVESPWHLREASALSISELLAHQIEDCGLEAIPPEMATLFELVSQTYDRLSQAAETANSPTQSDQLFFAILRALPIPVIVCDTDGIIIFSNPGAQRDLGLLPAELHDRPLLGTLIEPENPSFDPIESLFLKEDPEPSYSIDQGYLRSRGDRRVLARLEVSPIDSGATSGWVVSFNNLSDAKRAQKEAQKARQEAAIARRDNRAKARFLANMSHEIRTPLTAIMGYLDILDEARSDPNQFGFYIEIMKKNGEHLISLINDILDLSKIEAGRLEVERIPCQIGGILDEVYELLKPAAESKGLEFELCLCGEIPKIIQGDPTRLKQVLLNLTGNALKFTEKGQVRIVAFGSQTERLFRVEVQDTGIGLNSEQILSIFDAFAQADATTTRRFGGTGLGLTISNHLINKLGGKLDVKSVPAQGSCFALHLDGLVDHETEWNNPSQVSTEQNHPARSNLKDRVLEGLHALVVDDGPDNRLLFRTFLESYGARVSEAENGMTGLAAVIEAEEDDDAFDVILLDMQMPLLDGYEAARSIRDLGVRTPIIGITAHAMRGDREKCLQAGCDEYLTKPTPRKRLVATVARMTERAQFDSAP